MSKKKEINQENQLLKRVENWYDKNISILIDEFKKRVNKIDLDKLVKEFITDYFNKSDKCLATIENYDENCKYTKWSLSKIDNYDVDKVYDDDSENFLGQVYEVRLGYDFSPVSYEGSLHVEIEEKIDDCIYSLKDMIPQEFENFEGFDLLYSITLEDEAIDFVNQYLYERLNNEYIDSFKKYVI